MDQPSKELLYILIAITIIGVATLLFTKTVLAYTIEDFNEYSDGYQLENHEDWECPDICDSDPMVIKYFPNLTNVLRLINQDKNDYTEYLYYDSPALDSSTTTLEMQVYCPNEPDETTGIDIHPITGDYSTTTEPDIIGLFEVECRTDGMTRFDNVTEHIELPSEHFYKIKYEISNENDYQLVTLTSTTTYEFDRQLSKDGDLTYWTFESGFTNSCGYEDDCFILIENIETDKEDTEAITYLDPTLSIDEPDIGYAEEQFCFIGSSCYLTYYYNSKAIGSTLYIVDYLTPYKNYALNSQVVPDSYYGEARILLPESDSFTEDFSVDFYQLILETPGQEDDKFYSQLLVRWVASSTFEEYIDDIVFQQQTYDELCADLATTTSEGWFDQQADNFRYAIECAGRKLMYRFVKPDQETVIKLQNETSKLKNNFPLSIYNQLVYNTKRGLGQGSTTIAIPLSVGEINLGTYIDENTFQALGSSIYDKYRWLAKTFIYICFYFYILVRIFQVAGNTAVSISGSSESRTEEPKKVRTWRTKQLNQVEGYSTIRKLKPKR